MTARLFLAAIATTAAASGAFAQQTPYEIAPATLVASSDVNDIALRQNNVLVDLRDALDAGVRGMPIVAADDVSIGRIDRLNPAAGTAIVSMGGFWGLGQRQVVLPLDQISFQRHADGNVSAYIGQPSDRLGQISRIPRGDFS
ncbi:hypothetical protein Q4511_16030 [Paracoccus sp. 1_MG-2023]|uniref:hypothetical protein n=1 Tax=unclassified Paracoccus (in: a-proteobacteria) TaxID=2688777 RepID=UPI001C08F5AC|nr:MULTISPECIES: hypothetical protein [unclassified Paracoccus (in: a-proteobacteria)]MBU2958900.1 hypothetical protein [Paracoccus sp. C2R09]MDO6670426.1 hypothetical protein [Paracoccus sp. 1_MG-2023]